MDILENINFYYCYYLNRNNHQDLQTDFYILKFHHIIIIHNKQQIQDLHIVQLQVEIMVYKIIIFHHHHLLVIYLIHHLHHLQMDTKIINIIIVLMYIEDILLYVLHNFFTQVITFNKLVFSFFVFFVANLPIHSPERQALDLAGSREQRGSAFELYRKPQVGNIGHHHNVR